MIRQILEENILIIGRECFFFGGDLAVSWYAHIYICGQMTKIICYTGNKATMGMWMNWSVASLHLRDVSTFLYRSVGLPLNQPTRLCFFSMHQLSAPCTELQCGWTGRGCHLCIPVKSTTDCFKSFTSQAAALSRFRIALSCRSV